MKVDIEFHWAINYFCNYRCDYCFYGRMKDAFIGLEDIKKISNGFDSTGLSCLINISGGEPFFAPNFLELCEKLTRRHILSVNTNLSHNDVFQFAEIINPSRVKYICCSLHIQERERIQSVQDYVDKYKFLEKKGFHVFTSYVTYPSIIDRFPRDYLYFKSKGIILRPKIFRGEYRRFGVLNSRLFKRAKPLLIKTRLLKKFPKAYTKEQREKITSYIEESEKDGGFHLLDHSLDTSEGRILDLSLERFFLNSLPSFKGSHCLAGKSYVRMTPTGEVYRCHGSDHYLGNLFEEEIKLLDEPTKCPYNVCLCPYIGYSYVYPPKYRV